MSADLDAIRVQYNLPGISALAVKNGEIVAQGASGYRRHGYLTHLLATDPINLGSCSKWMTATVAGRLVDQNRISWTTTVRDCFSNYTLYNSAFQNATLEQFLAHRSGVQRSTTFNARYLSALIQRTGTFREIRFWVTETILKDAPEVQPGEFLYANEGYAVAAAMMEELTGQDWESLIQELVFTPLKMYSTTIGVFYNEIIPPFLPVGHKLLLNSTEPDTFKLGSATFLHNAQGASGPGGFIVSTLQDWVRFLRSHITGVSSNYLSAETAMKLKRSFIGEEGYGLGVYALNRTWATPGQALFHDGDIFGQNTVFWMTPSRDLIVAAYTNCRSDGPAVSSALDNVAWMLISTFA